jgi:chorismate mutase
MYALRGAISVDRNEPEAIWAASEALARALLESNGLAPEQLVSAVWTATPDLNAAFPATGARRGGFASVPMLGAQELAVPGAPEAIIRVLVHVDGPRPNRLEHVYLGRAAALRPDWVVGEGRS